MNSSPAWQASDHPYAAGSGADKLVDSGVAPLVGFARGMRAIRPGDVKALVADIGQAANSKIARQVKRAVGATDALWMPWFQADQVVAMQRSGALAAPASAQLRPDPANRTYDEAGRAAKYINLAGLPTVIGPHPAIPSGWLVDRSRPLMFAEGMLKADSALTGMLLAAGIGPDQLRVDPAEDVPAARARLAALLETVPGRQVVVYGFVSVTTFGKNPEWNAIAATGDCYVAFDGDIATNPAVWRGGAQLFDLLERKGGTPRLIDLSGQQLPDGAKCGVDDYLSKLGDWDALLGLAVDELPPKPAVPQVTRPGDWRMNPQTLCAEEWRAPVDANDPGGWIVKHRFVARVSVIEDRRQVTGDELRTGEYQQRDDARNLDSFCEIEVSWFDADGIRRLGVVSGPADLMGTLPGEWRRIAGSAVPSAVNHLATWPPREPEFMVAAKQWRADETVERPLWNHMGWVPTRAGSPVFVVGTQVVGASGFEAGAAASAVTDAEVRTASRFGVQMPDDDEDARQAVRRVLDTYRPAKAADGPWRNQRNASIFLAAALRPTIPQPCRVPVLLSGASGAGKSWSSAAVMMFWQAEPGTWNERSLPGSAADTFASSEVAISKTPIWVVDDLAPSESNPSAHGRQTDAVNQLIRNVHNGASRARRTADMRAQDMNPPRALLIVSAEQPPDREPSIMNRLVHVQVRARQFLAATDAPTDRLVQLGGDDGSPQSKVTGYILRMLARRASRAGWPALVEDVRAEMDAHADAAKNVMARHGSSTRQAKTVADLALGLTALGWAVDELGLDSEYGDLVADMVQDLYVVAREGYESAAGGMVGHQFMASLTSALSAHKAHVGALGQAGPPVTAGTLGYHATSDAVNDLLGWTIGDEQTDPRPGGPRVGQLVSDHNGRLAVLFDPTATYEAVKAEFRSNSATSVWESACQAGWQLAETDGGWKVRTSGGGAGWRQRVRQGGVSMEGVVVPLWRLLGDERPEDIGSQTER